MNTSDFDVDLGLEQTPGQPPSMRIIFHLFKAFHVYGAYNGDKITHCGVSMNLKRGSDIIRKRISLPFNPPEHIKNVEVEYIPNTEVPLAQFLFVLVGVSIVVTSIEALYWNRNATFGPSDYFCNIKIPNPGFGDRTHKPVFHPEFLIPTATFPQKFFLEKIQQKSDLEIDQIFDDYVYYRNKILKKLASISAYGIRGLVFYPSWAFSDQVIQTVLTSFCISPKLQIEWALLKLFLILAFALHTTKCITLISKDLTYSFAILVVVCVTVVISLLKRIVLFLKHQIPTFVKYVVFLVVLVKDQVILVLVFIKTKLRLKQN